MIAPGQPVCILGKLGWAAKEVRPLTKVGLLRFGISSEYVHTTEPAP